MKASVILILSGIFFFVSSAQAQTEELPGAIHKLSILGLGYQYEGRLSNLDRYETVAFSAMVDYGFFWSSTGQSGGYVGPRVGVEYRNYFNTEKRIHENRRIDNYSGFYLGAPLYGYLTVGSGGGAMGVEGGVSLGFQYCFGKERKGYFQTSWGLGYGVSTLGNGFVFPSTGSIGLILETRPLKTPPQ